MSRSLKHYVIFGTGRAGLNIAAWLQGLGHTVSPVTHEQAHENPKLCHQLIGQADIIGAALPDAALKNWFETWQASIGARPAIHFSGASVIDGMAGFHPLYSFARTLIPEADRNAMAFACPENGPAFLDIFPHAPNPHFIIKDAARAHYHALAVLSGNFAAYLWNETAKEFAAHYEAAPEQALTHYYRSIVDRFCENPLSSLTGPIARQDEATVNANLAALHENPKLTNLYKAFLASAWPDYNNGP